MKSDQYHIESARIKGPREWQRFKSYPCGDSDTEALVRSELKQYRAEWKHRLARVIKPDGEMLTPKATSKTVTEALRLYTYKHPIAINDKQQFLNGCVDADFAAVTASGQIYEYEVKISRSDFLRDFKKRRHAIYNEERRGKRPNRFWYVTPPGIVRGGELPKWAGHMTYDSATTELEVTKKAPILWSGQHDLNDILKIAKAMKRRGKPQP